jgi:hypothetical protein
VQAQASAPTSSKGANARSTTALWTQVEQHISRKKREGQVEGWGGVGGQEDEKEFAKSV